MASDAFEGGLIARVPVCCIPERVRKYPNFLSWWRAVGRLNLQNHDGWSSISGPHVMRGRKEIIAPHDWESLSEEDRAVIREWAEDIPTRIFYD